MQEVFNFIFSHLEAILSVVTLIISVVVFIVRKKPVLVGDYIKTVILNKLPTFINYAENSNFKGDEKCSFALTFLFDELEKDGYGSYSYLLHTYYEFARKSLEDILSTPQKKED